MKSKLNLQSMLALDVLRNRSELAHDAFTRACASTGKRAGLPKKRAPNRTKDPLAWAAWAGYETGMGRCNEGTVAGLMLASRDVAGDVHEVWDEVSDWVLDGRRGAVQVEINKWLEG